MKVREAMGSDLGTVGAGASAVEVARVMRDRDVGMVPIVESDRLVGAVTDRDVALRVVADGRDPESVKAAEIASRELVTVDRDRDVEEAMRLMEKHQVRRLPVVEQNGKLVGILAQADVATHATPSQTGKVVEKISN